MLSNTQQQKIVWRKQQVNKILSVITISYFKAIRSGTSLSKHWAEKDRGYVAHLVTTYWHPSWETAVCGIEPKGNGWHYLDEIV